jgi:hypothetical protein
MVIVIMIVQIVNSILACKIMYVLRSSDGKLQQHICCRETDIDHVRHYEGSIKDAGFGPSLKNTYLMLIFYVLQYMSSFVLSNSSV